MNSNTIPMQTGVKVKDLPNTTERAGQIGTSISRPSENSVEVKFEDGGTATFHQNELEVLT